jgi:hypothetical protein
MTNKTVILVTSDICTAFDPTGVIGSKVIDYGFNDVLRVAIRAHDFSKDRIPGQGFLQIPDAVPFVSAGVGLFSANPDHFVLREHRGKVSAYLKREYAAPVEGCAAVVYTLEAYLRDPDVTKEETARITAIALLSDDNVASDDLFVVVAVLAFSGPQSQLSPYRFTANLAGGNKEAQVWTADEIRAKAKAIMEYDNAWVTVADAL